MNVGQSCGLIHDLPGAAEVVQAIVREARASILGLAARITMPEDRSTSGEGAFILPILQITVKNS